MPIWLIDQVQIWVRGVGDSSRRFYVPWAPDSALMVRGVVERCDWYVVADPAVAARVKLELPPALAGRVVPA